MNITLSRDSSRDPRDSRDSRDSRNSTARGEVTRNITTRNARNARNATRPSVQSRLTEDTFGNFLDGFQAISPDDLLEAKGGRVRYVIESVDAWGGVTDTQYRLGGWLTKVDPALRYIRLVNPYAKKAWSVQLRPPGKRVRLYYMPPGTSDEVATMRNLLTQLESGRIRITRAP